jgi:hypothetical protein
MTPASTRSGSCPGLHGVRASLTPPVIPQAQRGTKHRRIRARFSLIQDRPAPRFKRTSGN